MPIDPHHWCYSFVRFASIGPRVVEERQTPHDNSLIHVTLSFLVLYSHFLFINHLFNKYALSSYYVAYIIVRYGPYLLLA